MYGKTPTMTVEELVAELQTLPAGTAILVRYEGVAGGIAGPVICHTSANEYTNTDTGEAAFVAVLDVELY